MRLTWLAASVKATSTQIQLHKGSLLCECLGQSDHIGLSGHQWYQAMWNDSLPYLAQYHSLFWDEQVSYGNWLQFNDNKSLILAMLVRTILSSWLIMAIYHWAVGICGNDVCVKDVRALLEREWVYVPSPPRWQMLWVECLDVGTLWKRLHVECS